jgi:hypothetical protein
MERAIDVPNSSRTLIDILRSTLSLVGYYGDVSGYGPKLQELKNSLRLTIADLETVSKNESVDPISPFASGRPTRAMTRSTDPINKRA